MLKTIGTGHHLGLNSLAMVSVVSFTVFILACPPTPSKPQIFPAYGYLAGGVAPLDAEGTYGFDIEFRFPAGLHRYDFDFVLPAGKRISAINGTSVFRASCTGQYLAQIQSQTQNYALANGKVPFGGGVSSFYISDHIGFRYTGTKMRVHVEADPECSGEREPTTWEFQGHIAVEP